MVGVAVVWRTRFVSESAFSDHCPVSTSSPGVEAGPLLLDAYQVNAQDEHGVRYVARQAGTVVRGVRPERQYEATYLTSISRFVRVSMTASRTQGGGVRGRRSCGA